MRIALTGNPNSGKTTMYNALTGRIERVGNWAGVTVEKKESPIKKSFYEGTEELIAVDLPGAYSMSPFTSEESITSAYVKNEKPDVIINIVDATNLSRSLFFTTQLLELGIPVVVALNKSDINEKKATRIDEAKLSEKLGCPVIETVSTSSGDNGLKAVVAAAVAQVGKLQKAPYIQADIDLADMVAVEAEDRKRFAFVNKIVDEVEKRKVLTKDKNVGDKIDAVVAHPILGIGVFAIVMWLVFYISQATVGTWIADWLVGILEGFQGWVADSVEGANPFLQSLLVDGVIGGLIAVVGFLPLVMVMYFLIALLEDCGYMARATVVLDPIFKRVGLSGKSVIPMVVGIGCAIPGVMASRTIRNERERRATAMLTPFMPCGAKLPVISLFAGAFFGNSAIVTYAMYVVGILLILVGALVVNAVTGYKYRKSFFIIELPEYKVPSFIRAGVSMLDRGKAYIIKAGTIILVCNTIVQILQSFTFGLEFLDCNGIIEAANEYLATLEAKGTPLVGEELAVFWNGVNNEVRELASQSILATIASPISYILVPVVGVAAWQLAAAAVTGFIAKENVVGTIAVCYGLSAVIDTEELTLVGDGNVVVSAMAITKVAALAYLMFNLYTPPCFAALGAMNSEMRSKKWLWGGIALQLGIGFTVAFFVYQIGTLITEGTLGVAFLPGLIAILAMALILALVINNTSKKFKNEYTLSR